MVSATGPLGKHKSNKFNYARRPLLKCRTGVIEMIMVFLTDVWGERKK